MVKVAQKANCQLGTEGSSSSGFLAPAAPEEAVWMPEAHPDSQANCRQAPAARSAHRTLLPQTTCSFCKLSCPRHPLHPLPECPSCPAPVLPARLPPSLCFPPPGTPAHRRGSASLCVQGAEDTSRSPAFGVDWSPSPETLPTASGSPSLGLSFSFCRRMRHQLGAQRQSSLSVVAQLPLQDLTSQP